MDEPPTVSEGWYPDPWDPALLRLWDPANGWTAQTKPAPQGKRSSRDVRRMLIAAAVIAIVIELATTLRAWSSSYLSDVAYKGQCHGVMTLAIAGAIVGIVIATGGTAVAVARRLSGFVATHVAIICLGAVLLLLSSCGYIACGIT